METIKVVKKEEAESKKEEATYHSDETVSAEEVDFANPMTQIDPSKNKTEITSKFDDYGKAQEVINISSDSETESAKQKTEKALLWKSRPPKKCSKYIPEEVPVKHEIGWLSKRQAPFKSIPANALESLVETCRLRNQVLLREAMNERLQLCLLIRTI